MIGFYREAIKKRRTYVSVLESIVDIECVVRPAAEKVLSCTIKDYELSVKQIKSVKIEELLGRKPIQLDQEEIRGQLFGKTVLVTGGGTYNTFLLHRIRELIPSLCFEID